MNERIGALVIECATELNHGRTEPIPIELGAEAPLFGREGVLDSLGLVSLVLAVEDSIEERFGIDISIADRRAVSQRSSPFRTIGTLTSYVEGLLQEAGWTAR